MCNKLGFILLGIFFFLFFFSVNSFSEEKINFSNLYFFGFYNSSQSTVELNFFFKKNFKDISVIRKKLLSLSTFLDVEIDIYKNVLVIFVVENPVLNLFNVSKSVEKRKLFTFFRKNGFKNGFFCSFSKLQLYTYLCRNDYFMSSFFPNDDIYYFSYAVDVTTYFLNFFISIENNFKIILKKFLFLNDYGTSMSYFFKQIFFYNKDFLFHFKGRNVLSCKKINRYFKVLKNCYNGKGYINFFLKYVVIVPSIDLVFFDIFVCFEKGKKFFINTILIRTACVNNLNFFYELLMKDFLYGTYFSKKKILILQKTIQYNLKKFGFFSNRVCTNVIICRKYSYVDVKFFVLCNNRSIIKTVKFVGNNITKISFLQKNLFIKMNSWFSICKVFDITSVPILDINLLFSPKYTIFFKKKYFLINYIDILCKIYEDDSSKFSGNFNFNFSDGLTFSTSADLSNFLGSGKHLNFLFERNIFFYDYNLYYYDPNFFKRNFGFGFRLCYTRKHLKISNTKYFTYSFNVFGYEMFVVIPFLKHRISLYTGYERLLLRFNKKNVFKEQSKFLSYEGVFYREFYLLFNIRFNSLKKLLFPNRGFLHTFNFYLSLPFSNLTYFKFNYSFDFYKTISKFCLHVSTNFFYYSTYNCVYNFPFFRKYFINTNVNFKGFKDHTLGRIFSGGKRDTVLLYDYDNLFLNVKTSLILPNIFFLKSDIFQYFVFFDLYYLPVREKYLLYSSLKFSSGLALLWKSPFGVPIEFCFSIPFFLCDVDKKQNFSFALLNFG